MKGYDPKVVSTLPLLDPVLDPESDVSTPNLVPLADSVKAMSEIRRVNE
jgi:hypothetical protein